MDEMEVVFLRDLWYDTSKRCACVPAMVTCCQWSAQPPSAAVEATNVQLQRPCGRRAGPSDPLAVLERLLQSMAAATFSNAGTCHSAGAILANAPMQPGASHRPAQLHAVLLGETIATVHAGSLWSTRTTRLYRRLTGLRSSR
jgi:hypothetical protein